MTDKATGYPIPDGRSYKLPKWSLTGPSSSDCIMKSKLLGSGGVSTLHNLYNKQDPYSYL